MKRVFYKAKYFFETHERQLSASALVTGFVIDNLTLKRIDLLFENLVLLGYILIAVTGIAILNLSGAGKLTGKLFSTAPVWASLLVQYAFGGLFSGFFIFYSRSGSALVSLPFLVILLVLLVGNEFFKNRYQKLTFQVAILFIAIFSYSIFILPILLRKMGPSVFILSGIVSLLAISILIYALSFFIPRRIQEARKPLTQTVVWILIVLNGFYFLNIIPPIPLSLKEGGVYHLVEKTNGVYLVRAEERAWYERFLPRETLHITPGSPLYFYSAVFAPTALNAEIVHNWQYFNEAENEWVTASRIHFPISGGRDGGYRGYTLKNNVFSGKWRVSVENERGQILGRAVFIVRAVSESPGLVTKTY